MDSYSTLASFFKEKYPELQEQDDRDVAEFAVSKHGFNRDDFLWDDPDPDVMQFEPTEVTPVSEEEIRTAGISPYEEKLPGLGEAVARLPETAASMTHRFMSAGKRAVAKSKQKVAPISVSPEKTALGAQETVKEAEVHGKAAEILDPTWYHSQKIQRKLEKIRGKDPDLANSFSMGDVAGHSDILVAKAFLSGDENAKNLALRTSESVGEVAGERAEAAEQKKGVLGNVENLLNATSEMTAMLGKGAALNLVPGVGQVLSTSMWAMQGSGDIITQAKKQGADDDTALAYGMLGGLIYAGVEQIQLGQFLNRASKKLIKGSIRKQLGKLLVEKGKDYFKEVAEEGIQGVVIEDAIISSLRDSGYDIDNDEATRRKITAFKDNVLPAMGPMGLLSLLGVGAGATSIRGKRRTTEGIEREQKPIEEIEADLVGKPKEKLTLEEYRKIPTQEEKDKNFNRLSEADQERATVEYEEVEGDQEDIERTQGRERVREEPVEAKPVEEASREEIEAGRILQKKKEIERTHLEPEIVEKGPEYAAEIPGLRFDAEEPGIGKIKPTLQFTDMFTGDTFYWDPATGVEGLKEKHAEKREALSDEEKATAIAKEIGGLEYISKKPVIGEATGAGKYSTEMHYQFKTDTGREVTIKPGDTVEGIKQYLERDLATDEELKKVDVAEIKDLAKEEPTAKPKKLQTRFLDTILNRYIKRGITEGKTATELHDSMVELVDKVEAVDLAEAAGITEKEASTAVKDIKAGKNTDLVKKIRQAFAPNLLYGQDAGTLASEITQPRDASGKVMFAKRKPSYEQIIAMQRATEGYKAAIKDPKTGKVYSGWTHQSAMDTVPTKDKTGTYSRLYNEWDQSTDNVGFVDKEGSFVSRSETEKNYGVSTVEDLKDLRRGDEESLVRLFHNIDFAKRGEVSPEREKEIERLVREDIKKTARTGVGKVTEVEGEFEESEIVPGVTAKRSIRKPYVEGEVEHIAKEEEVEAKPDISISKRKAHDYHPKEAYKSQKEKRLVEAIYGSQGKEATPGTIRYAKTGPVQDALRDVVSKITKEPIHFIETDAGALSKDIGFAVDGFRLSGEKYGDLQGIYIDTDTQRPVLWTAMHEAMHSLPTVHKNRLYKAMKLTDEGVAKKLEEGEEFLADVGGEMMSRPEFWENLEKTSPSTLKAFARKLLEILNSVSKKIHGLIASDKDKRAEYESYLTDVDSFRDELTAVMEEYTDGDIRDVSERMAAAIRKEDQTKTPEFKKWFGDWENDPDNASKVVDGVGKPLARYHSTKKAFTEFKKKGLSKGYFFGSEMVDMVPRLGDEKRPYQYGANVVPVYLSIKNPKEIKYDDVSRDPMVENAQIEQAKKEGYDGLKIADIGTWVAFSPNQIKSAIGNIGTFKKESADIRFAKKREIRERVGEFTSPNTTYYKIDEYEKKKKELRRKLGRLKEDTIAERIRVENEIDRLDALNRDRIKEEIYGYAQRIGLRGEPRNRVDTLLKNARTANDFRKAVEVMDGTLQKRQHSRYLKAAEKAVEGAYTYLRKIEGKTRATTDIEANRALKEYLEGITGGDEDTKRKTKMLVNYYTQYGSEDIKNNRDAYIDELGKDVIEWIEGDKQNPLPESASKYVRSMVGGNLRNKTNSQLLKVVRDIRQIRKHGRIVKKIEEKRRREQLDKAATEVADAINSNSGFADRSRAQKSFIGKDRKKEERRRFLRNLKSFTNLQYDVMDTERILQRLSGERGQSTLKKMVFDPLYHADNSKKRGVKKALDWYKNTYGDLNMKELRNDPFVDITVEYKEEGKTSYKKVPITIADAMKIYAMSVNDSQREHLIWTLVDPITDVQEKSRKKRDEVNNAKRELAEASIDVAVNALPEKYKQMVRDTWKYYDEIQYERMNPIFAEEHGVDMSKESHYFPIRGLQTDRAETAVVADVMARAGIRMAGVQKGMTKGRIASRAALGETDYFEDLIANLLQVEHYIAFNKPVRDVNRFLQHSEVRESIKNFNEEAWKSVDDWLKAMAYGRANYGTTDKNYDKFIRTVRRRYSVFQLGLRLTSMMYQGASYFRGLSGVSKKQALVSWGRMTKNPKVFFDRINELSPQIESRTKDFELGIQEMAEEGEMAGLLGVEKIGNKVGEAVMQPMALVDKFFAALLWDAKYSERINSGLDQKDAVYAADELVRKTQSGGGLLASSGIMRGGEMLRVFTQFASDPIKGMNMVIEFGDSFKEMSTAQKMNTMLFGFVAPAAWVYFIKSGFRPPWEEPEELGKETIRSFSDGLPLIGPMIDITTSVGFDKIKEKKGMPVNKYWYEYISDVNAPIFGAFEDMVKAVPRASEGDYKPALEGVAQLVGVPAGGQIKRTVEGAGIALRYKNLKYMFLSKSASSGEFEDVVRASSVKPGTYKTRKEADAARAWAKKKKASWSPEKLMRYEDYRLTRHKIKKEKRLKQKKKLREE